MEKQLEVSSGITLAQWLDYWYESYAKRTVRRATAISYEGYIKRHIIPKIGSYRLSELNTTIFQDFFNAELDGGKLSGGRLSVKTVTNMERMLHQSVEKAVEIDIVCKNFVKYTVLPPLIAPDMRVFTEKEREMLLAQIARGTERYSFAVYIGLTLGLRVGEISGLQWSDINFGQKFIRIRRTVERLHIAGDSTGNKTEICIGPPKSRASVRDIPLTEEYCGRFIDYMNYVKRRDKDIIGAEEFLFRSTMGNVAEPRALQACFNRIVKKSGIDKANFHALRHTFATRAIEKGVDIKALSVILGHTSVSFTLTRYGHVLDNHKRDTMEKLLQD